MSILFFGKDCANACQNAGSRKAALTCARNEHQYNLINNCEMASAKVNLVFRISAAAGQKYQKRKRFESGAQGA